jgi:hypothetical protein
MLLISSEVKYRATDHNVGKGIWEGNSLNGSNLKVVCRESGSERSGELSYMLNAIAIQIECKDLATFTQEVYQVAPVPTASIKNAHSRRDVPAQNLIENIDVNVSKLLLNV